jgi:uncharacterized membrane protein
MFGFLRRKRNLFTEEEQARIIREIRKAESRTSGEIKVFVENKCSYMDALDRAVELFAEMNLDKTRERNAVLIYVALKDHQLAIFGDEGIHRKVGQAYWHQEVMRMIADFNREDYAAGIAHCVEDVGAALIEHFPYAAGDRNELSDNIEFGR